MAAMFSLGVFNPYIFSPKASPGSCFVQRSGVGYTALVGTCTNQIPQSVASFIPYGPWIHSNQSPLPKGTSKATISVWINPKPIQGLSYKSIVTIGTAATAGAFSVSYFGDYIHITTYSNDFNPTTQKINHNKWNFLATDLNTDIQFNNTQKEIQRHLQVLGY